MADCRGDSNGFAGARFKYLAELANSNRNVCAYGKVVILRRDGILTFQAAADGASAATFCGNSTAAAVSCLIGKGAIQTRIFGSGSLTCDISAEADGDTVLQRWIVLSKPVQERVWRGCRVLLLPTLNNYAILLDRLPAGISAEVARGELLGSDLASKLALLDHRAGVPVVEFFNSNGKHGAVPQTGLATIALAARSCDQLRACFPDGTLVYSSDRQMRKVSLPKVSDTPCGRLAIDLPKITVSLDRPEMDMVA